MEININGIKTEVTADVTTNLVTNLILGSDWIQQNNVYILTPEKRIMIKNQGREVSTPFIIPPIINYPVTLINHVTVPPFSELMVEAQLQHQCTGDVLFEPTPRLQHKALFLACTLLNIHNNKIKISVINATNHQQTLSEGTKMGTVTPTSSSVSYIALQNDSRKPILKGKRLNSSSRKGNERIYNMDMNP